MDDPGRIVPEARLTAVQDALPASAARFDNSPVVDAVLVLYNSADHLAGSIGSVMAQGVDCRIILVENFPGDGSLDAALAVAPDASVLRPGKNLGFGGGCNLGASMGTAPYILLLNPDARLHDRCLRTLVESMESDPSLGAVGPLVLRMGDGTIDSAGMEQVVPGWARDRLRGSRRDLAPPSGQVGGLSGGVLLLRREALTAMGRDPEIFWTDLFLYNEDVELSLALVSAGWKLGFVREAVASHVVGGSGGRRRLVRAMAARNRILTALVHARGLDLASPRFWLLWFRRAFLDLPQLSDNLRMTELRRGLGALIAQVPSRRRLRRGRSDTPD
jgi:GT2 family glycosyltransferase